MYSTVETYRDEDISTEWLRVRGHHKVVFAAVGHDAHADCLMRFFRRLRRRKTKTKY